MAVSFETRLGLDLLPRTCCFGLFEEVAVLFQQPPHHGPCRGLHLAVDSAHSTRGCELSRLDSMSLVRTISPRHTTALALVRRPRQLDQTPHLNSLPSAGYDASKPLGCQSQDVRYRTRPFDNCTSYHVEDPMAEGVLL